MSRIYSGFDSVNDSETDNECKDEYKEDNDALISSRRSEHIVIPMPPYDDDDNEPVQEQNNDQSRSLWSIRQIVASFAGSILLICAYIGSCFSETVQNTHREQELRDDAQQLALNNDQNRNGSRNALSDGSAKEEHEAAQRKAKEEHEAAQRKAKEAEEAAQKEAKKEIGAAQTMYSDLKEAWETMKCLKEGVQSLRRRIKRVDETEQKMRKKCEAVKKEFAAAKNECEKAEHTAQAVERSREKIAEVMNGKGGVQLKAAQAAEVVNHLSRIAEAYDKVKPRHLKKRGKGSHAMPRTHFGDEQKSMVVSSRTLMQHFRKFIDEVNAGIDQARDESDISDDAIAQLKEKVASVHEDYEQIASELEKIEEVRESLVVNVEKNIKEIAKKFHKVRELTFRATHEENLQADRIKHLLRSKEKRGLIIPAFEAWKAACIQNVNNGKDILKALEFVYSYGTGKTMKSFEPDLQKLETFVKEMKFCETLDEWNAQYRELVAAEKALWPQMDHYKNEGLRNLVGRPITKEDVMEKGLEALFTEVFNKLVK